MITHIPSDIEMTFGYRKLGEQLGVVNAAYAFHRLWFDLGYQASVHGRCGIYLAADLHFLRGRLAPLDGDAAIKAMLDSQICEMRGADLFCPIFYHFNAHLDHSWIPSVHEWVFEWRDLVRALKNRKYHFQFHQLVDPLAWQLADGSRVSEEDMNRALRLIQTVDIILRHDKLNSVRNKQGGPRTRNELGLGLLQAAIAVVLKYSDTKLSIWLQRFMSLNRPRLDPRFRFSTEEVLRDFEELTWVAAPETGLEQWMNNTALRARFPENFEQETRVDDIRRELKTASINTWVANGRITKDEQTNNVAGV